MVTSVNSRISGLRRVVVESIRAARAYDAAHSDARRRAVLDRFISELDGHHPGVEGIVAVDDGRALPHAARVPA